MDKNHIDKIFQDGLKSDMTFRRADRQWKEVHDALYGKKDKSTWLPLALLFLSMIICFVAFNYMDSDNYNQSISKIEFDSAVILPSKQKNKDLVTDKENVLKEEKTVELQQSEVIRNAKKSSVKLIRKDETELCNCPADTLGNDQLPLFDESKLSSLTSYSDRRPESISKPEPEKETEEINQVLDLSSIKQFSFLLQSADRKFSFDIPEVTNYPNSVSPEKAPKNFVHLSLGALTDKLSIDQLTDSTSWNMGINVKFNLRKRWSLLVSYNEQVINRTFANNYEYYNYGRLFPETYAAEYTLLENSVHDLKVKSQNLDVGLTYPLFSRKWFHLEALGGIQFTNMNPTNVRLVSTEIYLPQESFIELPGHGFKMTDVFIGMELSIPIYKSFVFSSSYRYYHPTDDSFYKWGNRHRIFAGLSYMF